MKTKPPLHPAKRNAETKPAIPRQSSRPPVDPKPETREARVLGVRLPVKK